MGLVEGIHLFNYKFLSNKKRTEKKIDNYIKEVIEINQIPGLAVAVIKKEKIFMKNIMEKVLLKKTLM